MSLTNDRLKFNLLTIQKLQQIITEHPDLRLMQILTFGTNADLFTEEPSITLARLNKYYPSITTTEKQLNNEVYEDSLENLYRRVAALEKKMSS